MLSDEIELSLRPIVIFLAVIMPFVFLLIYMETREHSSTQAKRGWAGMAARDHLVGSLVSCALSMKGIFIRHARALLRCCKAAGLFLLELFEQSMLPSEGRAALSPLHTPSLEALSHLKNLATFNDVALKR